VSRETNVLILEDDPYLSIELRTSLLEKGFHAFICKNATEAIELCKQHEFDVAVVDIFVVEEENLIPNGGLSFMSNLKNEPQAPLKTSKNIPVIAISGGVSIRHGSNPLVTAMALGAVATLTKPFSHEQLITTIQEFTTSS